jgi:hypothetical protein
MGAVLHSIESFRRIPSDKAHERVRPWNAWSSRAAVAARPSASAVQDRPDGGPAPAVEPFSHRAMPRPPGHPPPRDLMVHPARGSTLAWDPMRRPGPEPRPDAPHGGPHDTKPAWRTHRRVRAHRAPIAYGTPPGQHAAPVLPAERFRGRSAHSWRPRSSPASGSCRFLPRVSIPRHQPSSPHRRTVSSLKRERIRATRRARSRRPRRTWRRGFHRCHLREPLERSLPTRPPIDRGRFCFPAVCCHSCRRCNRTVLSPRSFVG